MRDGGQPHHSNILKKQSRQHIEEREREREKKSKKEKRDEKGIRSNGRATATI